MDSAIKCEMCGGEPLKGAPGVTFDLYRGYIVCSLCQEILPESFSGLMRADRANKDIIMMICRSNRIRWAHTNLLTKVF